MLAADVPAGGQRAITSLVGQRPLPGQHLGFPAAPGWPCTSTRPVIGLASRWLAFCPAAGPARPLPGTASLGGVANLAHQLTPQLQKLKDLLEKAAKD